MFPLNVSLDVNIMNLPEALASAWGISTFSAGLLLSTLMLFSLLMATTLLNKGILLTLIVSLSASGFCIAIGWLPYWILIIEAMLIGTVYSARIKRSL